MSWEDSDAGGWVDGNYNSGDPAVDAAARLSYLDRQRRLGQGWHRGGWQDPEALLRQLDDQVLDGVQRQAEARRIEARRLQAPDRIRPTGRDVMLWLWEHPPEHGEPE